ncbi:DUF3114 domain-containing protein [Streptococcus ratti]|uniref:DUF3114 domain-containing protein n=1 Tax=Streptococcus ratti FA-1 = DSM 20564 TaxID=699248 RepID=A0ABP2QWQ0_STRRT|nr:DUF3114 domain-containing protein [Streptococcus ratti]EJN93445.1 hypothetical protein SRA_02876 [Streptococcus ratti FA-1 = DSM 20564]EMP71670.1 hypothetical protein D822_00550 [Streptococcus ratti FA-1 = DSM 20564]QEY07329.1 DUF3114 domain-containing protein [Streptococcus ratti]VEI59769.1 hypothetical cytosolic protein [Streptococcus mutans]
MWSILENYTFSQAGLNKRYQQAKQLLLWESAGWTRKDIKQLAKRNLQLSDFCIGSQIFQSLWQHAYGRRKAQDLLIIVLDMAAMPEELSGDLQENQKLVGHFSNNLAPDHAFWHDFSLLVQEVFPKNKLSAETTFAKRIHQFRYVISSQQAQYIRRHFKKSAMTDKEALAAFLKGKKQQQFWRKTADYSLKESARLHNKRAFKDGTVIYPDNCMRVNFKVLLNYHTEFILDDEGRFLNEIDAEYSSQNAIINGASFNYANKTDKRHWELDVNPAKRHDPAFRKKLIANEGLGFRAPMAVSKRTEADSIEDWQRSYFNKKGLYADRRKSNFKAVKKQVRQFKWKIFKLKWKRR